MKRYVLALAATALVVAAPAAAAKGAAGLTGEVGPGFTIEVKMGGKDLKTLKAGTYKIKVQDKASIHDFHLVGPGVNKATSVSGTGQQTWTVTFKKGTYKYMCDPHASSMKGSFKVT
jgi:plastocyanin